MKKILVVDDDPAILEVTTLILNDAGYEVFNLGTAINIVKTIKYFKPDLILLDISLPEHSGTEVCKALKQTMATPILLFTAHANAEQAYASCAADGYIEKPFDISFFLEQVRAHL